MNYAVAAPAVHTLTVAGREERFPVNRIFCVGRNYAAHAREMGKDPDREPPFFFMKPAQATVDAAKPATIPYPVKTANFHHEIELVLAIGKPGREIATGAALEHIFGYAVGNDLTRRDLQFEARDKGRPWDTGKAFDRSAAITAIRPVSIGGHVLRGRIWLSVNGKVRQDADVSELIWGVPELVAELSTLFELRAGDLIYTGTPAGVGPVTTGDRMEGGVAELPTLVTTIA
jgi:fumarylpyruvate hydrolase